MPTPPRGTMRSSASPKGPIIPQLVLLRSLATQLELSIRQLVLTHFPTTRPLATTPPSAPLRHLPTPQASSTTPSVLTPSATTQRAASTTYLVLQRSL